jgi:outer membrane protein OmpA-like peptidoglycan-associated protein
MRPAYPKLALSLWAVFLALGLALLCLPLSAPLQWLIVGVMLVMVLGSAWFALLRKSAAPTPLAVSGSLPIPPQLPVILVIGPHAAALFARSGQPASIRQDANAVWLHVDSPAQLSQAIASVHAGQQRFPQAALLPLLSDINADDTILRGEFAQWQRELSGIASHPDCELPCYVAVYAQLAGQRGLYAASSATWLGEVDDLDRLRRGKRDLRRSLLTIRQRLERSLLSAARPVDARRTTLGQALLDWLNDAALTATLIPLAGTAPLIPAGVLLADVARAPLRSGAWSRWLTATTGLQPQLASADGEPLPLPAFLPLPPSGATAAGALSTLPLWRGACHAIWLVLLALCVAFASSAWNNRQLIEGLGRDLVAYWKTSDLKPDLKRATLQSLIQDRAELQGYAQLGVPLRLSWGLYRGNTFLPLLDSAIASYRPPELATVTLDSVLLFDTGKTVLKAGAAQPLQQALTLIQANRKKNVLIAGHTDNIGNPQSNVALSEARARAVRDWFVKTSDLPVTHFAIQGFGDNRPLAGNDTESGRASNRRVEITLIADPAAAAK